MHKVLDLTMFKTLKGKLKNYVELVQCSLPNMLNVLKPMNVRLINKVTANPQFFTSLVWYWKSTLSVLLSSVNP